MEVQNLLNSLDVISEKLFKAVEGQVYEVLDNIVIIGPEILTTEPLKNIFFEDKINGIVIIANALIMFYVVHYIFTQLISVYNGNQAENIYRFILKTIIITLIVNNSYFLCQQILELTDALTTGISIFTSELSKQEISFTNLKENIISMKDFMSSDLLSLDGLIKGIISFGAVSILLNFSIRYVTIIFLIIISPLALVTLGNNLTSGICKSWFKILIVNLSIQLFVKLIILIPIMYKDVNNIMYKIILVGTIYILYKINNFSKELLVKISGEVQVKNIFK